MGAGRGRIVARAGLSLLVGLLGLGVVFREPLGTYRAAAGVLVRLGDPSPRSALDPFAARPFEETDLVLPLPNGVERARLYTPAGAAPAPALVLAHGVHRLGIDEPRLVGFARALAGAGFVVLTPELSELSDYRIDPRSIETIEGAARFLSQQPAAKAGGVGVMGFSFAGGLSVIAAIDGEAGGAIRYVVDVGGHHDLARVSRFFATNRVERHDGGTEALTAHPYGPVVIARSYAEEFFSAEDAPIAREVLRLWLWERREDARARAKALSPAGLARVNALFDDHVEGIVPDLVRVASARGREMARVSPKGKLHDYPKRAFLLHGAGDTVIPAAETLWMAQEMGPAADALVSRAISHVELGGETALGERFAVVAFMARVVREAEGRGAPIR